MGSRAKLATFALLIESAACSGQPAPRAHPRSAVEPLADADAPAFASPAHWDYHPARPDAVLAHVRQSDGGCVLATDGGQRWLVAPASHAAAPTAPAAGAASSSSASPPPAPGTPLRCAGHGQVARTLAPERLVAILRHGRQWLFVGESGALFEAPEPLASFTRTIPAPEPFASVTGDGTTLLAVTLEGRLMRWDESAGWRPGPAVATAPARLHDVALAEGGRAIALAFPETLFASEDGGVTWKPLGGAPRIGAARIGLTDSGALVAEGLVESLGWPARTHASLARTADRLADPPEASVIDAGRPQSAAEVLSGTAAIAGDRYVEAFEQDDASDRVMLARGKIEGRVELAATPFERGCEQLRVGANGKRIVMACVREAGDQLVAELRRSDDLGARWTAPAQLRVHEAEDLRIAVGPDGSALVTGLCREPQPCKTAPPILLRLEGARLVAASSAAPQLRGDAIAPAFSPDGRSAYFLGGQDKSKSIALYVSHDGGESFAARALDAARPIIGRGRADPDPSDEHPEDATAGPIEARDTTLLGVSEDGVVGAVLNRHGQAAYLTTDDDGRMTRIAHGPHDGTELAGWGRRAIAVLHETHAGNSADIKVWESLDGGATWSEVAQPPALEHDLGQGGVAAACGAGGCLIADAISRVGWNGQVESASPQRGGGPPGEPALRTPIACEYLPSSRWTRIDHVDPETQRAAPDVNQAMRGRSAWSLLSYDRVTGAVSATSATLAESGGGEARIVTRSLLAGASGGRNALDVSHQMEGYAAARVRLPVDARGEIRFGGAMQNVEVSWENYMDGTAGRATIPDAGVLKAEDLKSVDGRDVLANSLLSVSLHSIFVRPHAASASALTFLVDTAGRTERFDYPVWPAATDAHPPSIFGDAALIDGRSIAVGMAQGPGPSTVVLGHREPRDKQAPSAQPPTKAARVDAATTWGFSITALAPSGSDDGPLVTSTDWTYSGSSIGLTTFVADVRRARAWALFHGFRADGTFAAPRPVPTLADVGDRPRPCSASERESTPRVEALLFVRGREEAVFTGARHAVVVTEPPPKGRGGLSGSLDEGTLMLTSSAVLHGTPASPCIAAWQVDGMDRDPLGAIVTGDLAHGWVFRRAAAQSDAPQPPASKRGRDDDTLSVEVRPMACHYDPAAKVPDRVFEESGTRRSTR